MDNTRTAKSRDRRTRGVMGASGASAADPASEAGRQPATPADLVEFAIGRLAREETAAAALPAILGGLVTVFGCRAALALKQDEGSPPVVIAAHPAAAGRGVGAQVSVLAAAQGEPAAEGGYVEATLVSGGRPVSVRLVIAPPDDRRCPLAVALVGDPARFSAECRTTARAVAAIVSAQIRHAEDAAELAEWQARGMALFDRAPHAIFTVGADYRLVAFNPAAEELTGWQRDEVLGKKLGRTCLDSAGPGDSAGPMRMPVLRADGTERMVELTPVPLSIGGRRYFCGFLRDMSELQSAHVALLDSEGRFRLLSQLAPVGIVQTDLAGTCTYANDHWCGLTGMTPQQAVGAPWSAAVHPDDIAMLQRQWAAIVSTGRELRTDCRLLPVPAGAAWVHIAVVPISGADGRPLGFLAAATNISDRKRAEAEKEEVLKAEREARRRLADQTERLNGLVNAAIPGILLDDEHGLITQVNQSFCDLFGLREQPSQLIDTPASRVAIRIRRVFADPAGFLRRARQLVADRQPVALEEIACADGRTLEWDFAPVFVDGSYRGDLWGVADVTDRQVMAEQRERMLEAEAAAREAAEQARARLAEQNARLRDLDEAKTQFISTMSDVDHLVHRADHGRWAAADRGNRQLAVGHPAQRRAAAPPRGRPAPAQPAGSRGHPARPHRSLGSRPGPRGCPLRVGDSGRERHHAAGRGRGRAGCAGRLARAPPGSRQPAVQRDQVLRPGRRRAGRGHSRRPAVANWRGG